MGSGLYDMKMERMFVVDSVDSAAALIQRRGEATFNTLRDKRSEFRFRDIYIFVLDGKGIALVNAGFPQLEGQNRLHVKDASGKAYMQEMFRMLQKKDAGWVDYLWPKPGEAKPSKKSTYVRKIKLDRHTLYVAAGVYLH